MRKTVNGVRNVDAAACVNSKARDATCDSRKPDAEIPPAKQMLAAPLFGGSSKT